MGKFFFGIQPYSTTVVSALLPKVLKVPKPIQDVSFLKVGLIYRVEPEWHLLKSVN